MTPQEIKAQIDKNNEIIESLFNPNQFVLNDTVRNLLDENAKLQEQCCHEFEDGYCKYCYKEEG